MPFPVASGLLAERPMNNFCLTRAFRCVKSFKWAGQPLKSGPHKCGHDRPAFSADVGANND